VNVAEIRENLAGSQPVMGWAEICRLTRVSKSTIRRWMKKGFPQPLSDWPGAARVWGRREVLAYFDQLIQGGGK